VIQKIPIPERCNWTKERPRDGLGTSIDDNLEATTACNELWSMITN